MNTLPPGLAGRAAYAQPAELLQTLIRFDTTNPPGNEAGCIAYIAGILTDAGLQPALYGRDPARPNLLARLPGRGAAAPLLLYGHVDVVTTANQAWTHPPFAGEVAGGWIWGRGSLDMKGGLAMMIAALLRARDEGLAPPGDVLFAALADEECGGNFGAAYLVEAHPELFAGVRYAIGEFGGFTFYASGRKFYPIMIAEKQTCVVRATFHGRGGHSAMPEHNGAMARLAHALLVLDRKRLPVHVSTGARLMFEGMAAALPFPQGTLVQQLTKPRLADRALDLMGPAGQIFDPMLHNSVSPTMIQAGEAVNVIPAEVTLYLNARLVPGSTPEDLLAELAAALAASIAAREEVDLDVVSFDPGPGEPDMGLFGVLAGILREADPDGIAVPFLLPATTDARFLARLGIQTYGFTPMQLPPGLDFWRLAHGADERIPVDAVSFGADAVYRLLSRFGEPGEAERDHARP